MGFGVGVVESVGVGEICTESTEWSIHIQTLTES